MGQLIVQNVVPIQSLFIRTKWAPHNQKMKNYNTVAGSRKRNMKSINYNKNLNQYKKNNILRRGYRNNIKLDNVYFSCTGS